MWLLAVILIGLSAAAIASQKVTSSTVIYYLQMLAFGLLTQFSFLLPFLYFPFRPFDYRNANATAKAMITVEGWLGIRYTLTGLENLQDCGGVVLMNHQSFWDLVVLGYVWPHLGPVAIIAKKAIIFYPPVGPAIWSYGSVFVDRSNRKAALKSIEEASRAINTDQKKLIFFPEGTRSSGLTLRSFKNGAFISAFDNKCKIFPIVVPQFKFIDHAKKLFTAGTKPISVLPAVDSSQFSDFQELRDHCQVVMQKEYDRLNAVQLK